MSNPRYSSGPSSPRVRARATQKKAEKAMKHAEKYAPGLSIDMMELPTPTPTPTPSPTPAPGMKKGGMARSSASKRADGCAVKGKTRGKFV